MIQTCDLKGSQSERLIPKPAEVNMGPHGNFTGLCIPSCVLSGSRGWHHPHSPAVTPSPTLGTQHKTPPCLKSLGGKSSEQRISEWSGAPQHCWLPPRAGTAPSQRGSGCVPFQAQSRAWRLQLLPVSQHAWPQLFLIVRHENKVI